jgi:hypothetical protein
MWITRANEVDGKYGLRSAGGLSTHRPNPQPYVGKRLELLPRTRTLAVCARGDPCHSAIRLWRSTPRGVWSFDWMSGGGGEAIRQGWWGRVANTSSGARHWGRCWGRLIVSLESTIGFNAMCEEAGGTPIRPHPTFANAKATLSRVKCAGEGRRPHPRLWQIRNVVPRIGCTMLN